MLEELDPELADEIEEVAGVMQHVSAPPSRAVSLNDDGDGVKALLKRAAKECLYRCGVEIGKKPVEDMIADAVKTNAPNWESLEHDLDTHIADNHQRDWLDCAKIVNGISLDIQAAVGTPAEYAAKQHDAVRAPAPVSASASTLPSPVEGRPAVDKPAVQSQLNNPAHNSARKLCDTFKKEEEWANKRKRGNVNAPQELEESDDSDAEDQGTRANVPAGKTPDSSRYDWKSYNKKRKREHKAQMKRTDAKEEARDGDWVPRW